MGFKNRERAKEHILKQIKLGSKDYANCNMEKELKRRVKDEWVG